MPWINSYENVSKKCSVYIDYIDIDDNAILKNAIDACEDFSEKGDMAIMKAKEFFFNIMDVDCNPENLKLRFEHTDDTIVVIYDDIVYQYLHNKKRIYKLRILQNTENGVEGAMFHIEPQFRRKIFDNPEELSFILNY